MQVRIAVKEDLNEIESIYETAREFMRSTGNPTQWGNTDPAPAVIEEDIQLGRMHLLTDESNIIYVCFAFYEGPDPCYAYIEDGAWPNNNPYHVAHKHFA